MNANSHNPAVVAQVPYGTKRILDLGCGEGFIGHFLKLKLHCAVTGITFNEQEAAAASSKLDSVIVQDLNSFDLDGLGRFDCIICSHVLEHLYKPDLLLERLRDVLEPDGVLIVALPNILFWKLRWEFLRGRFRYADSGILDRTHNRFYDWRSAQELLEGAGYQICVRQADGGFPGARLFGALGKQILNSNALKYFPGFFGWQFVFRCHVASNVRCNNNSRGGGVIRAIADEAEASR